MSWGKDLWDQIESVEKHTQKGLDFCEKYLSYIKERVSIEQEYAKHLKRLAKNYQPKKKEEEDYEFSCPKGFVLTLKEISDLAGQHDAVAENFNKNIAKELASYIQELKQERKKHSEEGAKQWSALKHQFSQLDRSKKSYEKAFKEAEKAEEQFKKADADINLSRAEVEKAKNNSITKAQQCEDCKSDYASELQKSNNFQRDHYETNLPNVFQQMQTMEETRILKIQNYIKSSAEIERDIIPIVSKCIDEMVKAADSIDPKKDCQMVIDKYKSGFEPPGDIPFEDLSNDNGVSCQENQTRTPKPISKSDTFKGTISGRSGGKRKGLFGIFAGNKQPDETKEDFSHLPPNQQKKKLNQKIDSLKAQVAKETSERDGMVKLRGVYEQNEKMGDPKSLDKRLEENALHLDQLKQEIAKYEGYLAGASGNGSMTSYSSSSESLKKSNSDYYIQNQNERSDSNSSPQVQRQSFSGSQAPDIVQTSTHSRDDSFDDIDDDVHDDAEFSQEADVEIGTCRALYTFEATSQGSIAMQEGETFSIIEQDQGDGWTQVKNAGGIIGFVPTSYIECQFYGQV